MSSFAAAGAGVVLDGCAGHEGTSPGRRPTSSAGSIPGPSQQPTTAVPATASGAPSTTTTSSAAPTSTSSAARTGDYFPPDDDARWERVGSEVAGWDRARLADAMEFAGSKRSQSVVLLTGGRLVAEQQWGVPADYSRDIASAQKSVVAVLLAIAAEKHLLTYETPVNDLLGGGWTHASASDVSRIKVRHLMGMTSGLDAKLEVVAEPGSVWAYNNNAYHRLQRVVAAAAGSDLESVTRSWLWDQIGVRRARWEERPQGGGALTTGPDGEPLIGLVMNAYDLARFGLLVERRGQWGDRRLLSEGSVDELLRPSSSLNPSYGLLWWLNGQDGHRLPGVNPPLEPGPLAPGGPPDTAAALGANDQKAYVMRSLDSVLTRLGQSANGQLIASLSGFDGEWLSLIASSRR